MTPEFTGEYDASGIPIYTGDLVRVKHYVHCRNRRTMYLYFRVAMIESRFVLQNWDNLDSTEWQCLLEGNGPYEIVAESRSQRDGNGGIVTFNERPRKKGGDA